MTRKTPIPNPKPLTDKDSQYQPSKAGLEEEFDMPAMSEEELREAFMRPFEVETET